jgi:hypothetical protein
MGFVKHCSTVYCWVRITNDRFRTIAQDVLPLNHPQPSAACPHGPRSRQAATGPFQFNPEDALMDDNDVRPVSFQTEPGQLRRGSFAQLAVSGGECGPFGRRQHQDSQRISDRAMQIGLWRDRRRQPKAPHPLWFQV